MPGQNGAVQVHQEKKDPNTAPRGSAFTPEGADKMMQAAKEGIHKIMETLNLPGYAMIITMPIVEWREGIAMPGGTTKSDFVVLNGRTSAFGGPYPATPEINQRLQELLPMVWKQAYGLSQDSHTPDAADPAGVPDVPPTEEPQV